MEVQDQWGRASMAASALALDTTRGRCATLGDTQF
jgi:hypothetical protein